MTPVRRPRRRPRRSGPAGPGPGFPPASGTGQSGRWRWRCSTSWPGRGCARRWWSPTPATATTPTAGYGNNADFRAGIAARGAHYIVQVDGDLSAHPAEATPELRLYSGRGRRSRPRARTPPAGAPPDLGLSPGGGRRPRPRYRTRPVALRAHALAAGRDATVPITWRQ